MTSKLHFVDIVKWIATIIQPIGYGMTGLNLIPYNIYMFFIGIFYGLLSGSCGRIKRLWWSMLVPLSRYLSVI